MTGTAEAVRCPCGLQMSHLPSGVLFCTNCDQVQLVEIARRPRVRTREDVRFRLYWMNVMNKEYPPLPPGVSDTWVDDIFGGPE
jgi:hypothetical protein